MDEQYEWGVKHSQGLRVERDEKAARESLTWMLAAHGRSRPGTPVPVLVRRTVTPWESVED